MGSINKCLLIGNAGRDPEVRTTTKGTKVVNFSLATSRRAKEGDDWKNVTTWHNITAYAQTAEICEKYITKGSQVYVEGSIRDDSWEDKDGKRHNKTVIIANNIQLLGKKDDNKPNLEVKKTDYSDKDIPF